MFVKVTLRDAKEDVDEVCIEVQKTSDKQVENRDFSLQHKTFTALNYAQDFGTTVKESLKRTRNSNWATLTKSRVVQYQILSWLCQQSKLSLPSVQTVRKEDEVVIRDWIENFRPV